MPFRTQNFMFVGAIIGRPSSRSHPTVNCVAGSPSMRAVRKPLLEERCHEVMEWWQIERQGKATPQTATPPAPLNGSRTKSLSLRRDVTK